MSAFNFDATQVKPDTGGGFTLVPKGSYTATISSSELKQNSAKTGRFIELNFKIVGGEFNNVTVKERINVENASEEAQRIGLSQLSAICHSVSVLKLTSTEQLHGRPLTIDVDVENYEKEVNGKMEPRQSNRISAYKKLEGATAPTSAPPSFITQAAPPVAAPVAPVQPTAPPVVAPALPTPPPVSDKLYFFSHKGSAPEAVPVPLGNILAKGLPVEEVMVVENGQSTWQPLGSLVAAPSAPASTPPPWAKQ